MEKIKDFFATTNGIKLKLYGFIGTILLTLAWSGVVKSTILIYLFGFLGSSSLTIFAFLANEGMKQGRSVFRYMLRLLVFAVIAAFPYFMIYHDLDSGYTNFSYYLSPIFTIFYSVGALYVCDKTPTPFLKKVSCAVFCMLAMFFKVEFAPMSILLAYFIHVYDGEKQKKYRNFNIIMFFTTLSVVGLAFLLIGQDKVITDALSVTKLITMAGTMLGIPLINRYNGKVCESESKRAAAFVKWSGYFGYVAFAVIFAYIKYLVIGA